MTKVDLKDRGLFCDSSQPPQQEFPEIFVGKYQFNCPTVRSVVGPVDLYQGHKAGSDYSQNSGHENYHLHRRHSGDGAGSEQGTGSGAHREHSCWGTWGFTINRQKSLTDPTQEIDFLAMGLIADSILMELKLPGSKIKNIRSDAKALLQSQPTSREVSRLLGKFK